MNLVSPIDVKRIAIKKNERKIMHIILLTPMLALDTASSGAAFLVILAVVAAFRGR
jgi:hypothetical protein